MALGYIKRDNLREVYEEMVEREKSLIIETLRYMYPDKAQALAGLKISFAFTEPFATDERERMLPIGQLYQRGVISIEEAVRQLALCDNPDDEIKRIKAAAAAAEGDE